jgi:limonene 1,2-monooxygenase
MEMAVACTLTPNGPSLAGRFGLSMLSVAATVPGGFARLPDHWRICEQVAAENGRQVHRDSWRVVAPFHIAPTREQAIAEVAQGVMANVVEYLWKVGGEPMRQDLQGIETAEQAVAKWAASGIGPFGVLTVGTPDDVANGVERLLEQSGGYGCFMALAHNSADWQATQRSYEMFARYVMPRYQRIDRRADSLEFCYENSDRFIGAVMTAMQDTLEQHKDLLQPKEQAKTG